LQRYLLAAFVLVAASCTLPGRKPVMAAKPAEALVSIRHDGAEVANSNRDMRFVPEVYCLRDYAIAGDVFAVPDGFPARFSVVVSERWQAASAEVILYGGSFTDTDENTFVRSDVREGQNVEIASRGFEASTAPRREEFSFAVVPLSGVRDFGRETVKLRAQITDQRGEVVRTTDPVIGTAETLCGPQ
jgi:hypothetical protein